jgi:serine/threonine-protein kinase RsbW
LDSAPDICELSELAVDEDGNWIAPLVDACDLKSPLKDERSFVKQAFSAPLRAKSHGANVFLMLDNFEEIENKAGEFNLREELKEIYERSSISFVFAGRRRYVLNAAQSGNTKLQNVETLQLSPLSDSDAGLLAENLAEKLQIQINDQTRDLIIQQFRGNPQLITSIFFSAQDYGLTLDGFQQVEQTYINSLLGGRIGKIYDTVFARIAPQIEIQSKILTLLADEEEKNSFPNWAKQLDLPNPEFQRILHLLNIHEIVRLNGGAVDFADNEILKDYVEARYNLEIVGESRALTVGKMLADALKRAPLTMTRFYRSSSAIGLRELLGVFDCQPIPFSLLDYARFKELHKGAETAEIIASLGTENEKINLPRIVYTANCAAFYPPINQFTENTRSAVALGFETGNYTAENEVVWITAEIDSKLEASPELTEFWCDRLEMVALTCNFINYQLWLITPEGFTPEAVEILRERQAFGSSRQQVELLVKHLEAGDLVKTRLAANEYEMVIPMGDDTEMIAAHAVEDITRRRHFPPKSINQIKTALVEACINASEHSHSPDRKIYLKFTVEEDRIALTVSNRGIKIPADKIAKITEIKTTEGRRGWGLNLIRSLMDEVKFEEVDDGARMTMVKYLRK